MEEQANYFLREKETDSIRSGKYIKWEKYGIKYYYKVIPNTYKKM